MKEKRGYGENKTDYIGIRLTSEQKSKIFELAKMAGVSVSAYLVGLALGDSIGKSILEKRNK